MLGFLLGTLFPGDHGISQTVYAMRRLVHYGVRQAEVRAQAEQIIASCLERDEVCEVKRVHEWVQRHFHYVKDIDGVETVKSPEVSLKEIKSRGAFQGDCDDVVILEAALLKTIGYKVRAVVIVPPGTKGASFKHVYLEAYIPTRHVWVAFDGTAKGRETGWAAPSLRTRKYML